MGKFYFTCVILSQVLEDFIPFHEDGCEKLTSAGVGEFLKIFGHRLKVLEVARTDVRGV